MIALQVLSLCLSLANASPVQDGHRLLKRDQPRVPVSSSVYNDLSYYAQFPPSSEVPCTNPPSGIVQQAHIDNNSTDTQASIFRIDSRKEFVLGIPGSNSTEDDLTDLTIVLVPYVASGVSCSDCVVHVGFLNAWNSISASVEDALTTALAQYPDYTVTISGHSLGAALAELAFGSLKPQSFNVGQLFTYGSPRFGNQNYANYIDSLSGASDSNAGIAYRVTHADDFVPHLLPQALGLRHPSTEYWESNLLTPTEGTTYRCFGQEPTDCCESTVPNILDNAHGSYAGLVDVC